MIAGYWFFSLLILEMIFWEGNCEVYYWGKPFNETVVRAACSLECSDEPCSTNCTGTKEIKVLDEGAKADVRLICRDQSYLVLAHNPGLFVIERRHKLSNSKYYGWFDAVVTNATRPIRFPLGLVRSCQFRSHRISTDGISMPEITKWMDAYPDGYRPMYVTNITIGGFKYQHKQSLGSWTVKISFTPSEDRPCYYEVRCQQIDGKYNQMIRLSNVEDFSVVFDRLPFAANFKLTIKSLTDNLRRNSSNNVTGTITGFSTPRCLDSYAPTFCAPKAVDGLNATAIHKTENIFDVHVIWDPPNGDNRPFKYHILIQPFGGETKDLVSKVVDWRFTGWFFRNVHILDQYAVHIRGENLMGKGPIIWRRFTTGLKQIAAVEGLNATVTLKAGNTFDIRVTWDWPEIIPDFYIVNVTLNSSETDDPGFHNVSGSANETIFSDVVILEDFNVSVKAWSSAGGGPQISQRFEKVLQTPSRNNWVPIYVVGGISVAISIGIAVYGCFWLHERRLSQSRKVDKWEIGPDRLVILQIIGTGAFGVVKLGSLRDDRGNLTKVAVKMLPDGSNENDLKSLLHEMTIMKELKKHPNIVSLLGCRSTGPYPLLVVEYCSRGDLHSFLRKSVTEPVVSVDETKKRCAINGRISEYEEILQENSNSSSMSRISEDYIQVPSFPKNQDTYSYEPGSVVTFLDMLNFGRQIATGMECLSSYRIVHRDLAARNILVCEDRSVKISDFGLSRDIYQEDFYLKRGTGRMPLKWMAIEALTHQVYTTSSDVWSFGVLLWEIVTLGGSPYPGIPTMRILKQLQLGYRMPRPENCSIPLYNVMMFCWRKNPRKRPTFTILRQELDRLICMATENVYFDLDEGLVKISPKNVDSQIPRSRSTSSPVQVKFVNHLESKIVDEELDRTEDEV